MYYVVKVLKYISDDMCRMDYG